jgi:phosphoribosyl-AMP cyclohydrolase
MTMTAEQISSVLQEITFDDNGLVPAIAQQHDTGEVLMLAWMNREAVIETLAKGQACYWSRSRRALWRKGETSGQTQAVRDFRIDCDGDTVLLVVDQKGVACHTGRRTCFFRSAGEAGLAEVLKVEVAPDKLYGEQR